MEQDVKTRLAALVSKVCYITNEMELLKIEREYLLNEIRNTQLKLQLDISPEVSCSDKYIFYSFNEPTKFEKLL